MSKIKKNSPYGLRKTVYPDNTLKTLVDLQGKINGEFVAYTSDHTLSQDEILCGKKVITNNSATSVVTYTLPPVQYGAIVKFFRSADFNMIISADGSNVIDNVTDDYTLYGGNPTVTLIGNIEGWVIEGKGVDPIPIGAIVAIHPEVDFTKALNGNYWKLCDGTTDQTLRYQDGTTYLGSTDNFDIPEISDDRFLMGISGTVVNSDGSNTMYDHKHSHNSTDLVIGNTAFANASGSVSINHGHSDTLALNSGTVTGSATSSGEHCHTLDFYSHQSAGTLSSVSAQHSPNNTGTTNIGGAHTHPLSASVSTALSGGVTSMTGTCSFSNVGGNLTSGTIEGSIGGSGTEADVSGDTIENRPSYFSVRYYMKIK